MRRTASTPSRSRGWSTCARAWRAAACPTGWSCRASPPSTSSASPGWAGARRPWSRTSSPRFIVPGHLRGAARALKVPALAVDGACVVPMQRIPVAQIGARTLRPRLTKLWPEHLKPLPDARTPGTRRGPSSSIPASPLSDPAEALAALSTFAIDHAVPRVAARRGGRKAALKQLRAFVAERLASYDEARNEPGADGSPACRPTSTGATSSPGEAALAARDALGEAHPGVQGFLEELLVRRELGFNYCFHTPRGPSSSRSPPCPAGPAHAGRAPRGRARAPLHIRGTGRRRDGRRPVERRPAAAPPGGPHPQLPADAVGQEDPRVEPDARGGARADRRLNDRYALDGRDPASVANFMWCLGLHDRPFQERAGHWQGAADELRRALRRSTI